MNNADLRYHIASLSAVFLALGIGILIGTAFVGSPIVARQTGALRRLETHVSELREETRDRERTEEALNQLLPQTVRGALRGKRVLVVQTGNYADATTETVEALQLAGATTVLVTLPPDSWRSRQTRPELTEDDISDEARKLALALATGATDQWKEYRDTGLLTGGTAGGETGIVDGAVRSVVLVGGESSGTDTKLIAQRDLPMIEEWHSAGLNVVGVEPFKSTVSYLPAYRSAGLTTIDGVDRAAGKIALPFAVRGEAGAFGYRIDADHVLPLSVGVEPSPTPAPALSAKPKPSPSPKPSPAPRSGATP